jgi:hypothetical protein
MSVFRSGRKSHCSGWSIDDFLNLTTSPWVKDRVVPQAGLRQGRVLRAEGERLLWIFQAQGEAQARFVEKFRSMTLGTGRLMLFTGDQNVEQLTDVRHGMIRQFPHRCSR